MKQDRAAQPQGSSRNHPAVLRHGAGLDGADIEGPDPNATAFGTTAGGLSRVLREDVELCDAASTGDLRKVKRLLASGSSPESADEEGTTALMVAAFAGQVRVVQLLLDAGANPNSQDISGTNALLNAVIAAGELDPSSSHPAFFEIVGLLLAAGADPDLRDEDGTSALDQARISGLYDLAARLEESPDRSRRDR